MALDQQSNWNVEMSQPLRLKSRGSEIPATSSPPVVPSSNSSYTSREVILPIEVIIQIVSYVPWQKSAQKTLWACSLVSRLWYSASIPFLYKRPHLSGGNFQLFVVTVCPSKNAHIRRSHLAELVETLDMGELVHDGSKSLTARLLGRLKGNLTEFVAPQASFSINSFAALSKCTGLTHLNLSLMSSSISIKLLFQTLRSLAHLQTLYFPRTATHDHENDLRLEVWPPKLRDLHLAGGIDDSFLRKYVSKAPLSLERLSIQHSQRIYAGALEETLMKIGPQLRHLTVRHPMAGLHIGALDDILVWCPKLVALRLSADYITDLVFQLDRDLPPHPLRILDLDCSDSANMEVALSPDAIWIAIDSGYLSDLRSIRVSARLAWDATETLRRSVTDLVDQLVQMEKDFPLGVEPGVWSTFQ